MKILHGTHEVHAHQALVVELQQATAQGHDLERIQAKQCSQANLELLLGEQSLFLKRKLLIIEELHSLPRSANKQALIEYLQAHQDDTIILWERKDLTASELKKFPRAQIVHFPMSSTLFTWLDCLGDKQVRQQALSHLAQAIKHDGAGFCFVMLARQTRLLLLAKDGGPVAGPPFVQAKLHKQAKRFLLNELLLLHQHLLEFDQQNKTSSTALTLEQQLDLFTLSL